MKTVRFLPLLALIAATPAFAEPDYAAAIRADWDASLGSTFDWFHRNPELSFKEVNTAARSSFAMRAAVFTSLNDNSGLRWNQSKVLPSDASQSARIAAA